MLSWISALALVAAFQAPEARTTPTAPPAPLFAAEADWAKRPTAQDLARFYPERAKTAEVGGLVALACSVDRAGALSRCAVSTETPTGYGFGDAALKVAETYLMRPERAVSWAEADRKVLVPIRFRASEINPLPPGFSPRGRRVPLPRGERT